MCSNVSPDNNVEFNIQIMMLILNSCINTGFVIIERISNITLRFVYKKKLVFLLCRNSQYIPNKKLWIIDLIIETIP